MNAKTRTQRRTLKDRARANHAATRLHRNGEASLTSHLIAQGLNPRDARTIAGTLRKTAHRLGITGTEHRVHAARRMRTTHRYTPAQVAQLAAAYKPRKAAYRLAAEALRLAA